MTRTKVLTISLGVLVLTGALLALLDRGYFGPPAITVVNGSGSIITNVVLEGDGLKVVLPDLVPGGSVTMIVHPPGESGLKIEFQLADRLVTRDDLTYIESSGGSLACVTVRQGGKVECQSGSGFSWRRAI